MTRDRIAAILCSLAGAVLVCAGSLALAQDTTNATAADKKFVKSALEGRNGEVMLGQLAAQKGNSEDVKQFGQKMVDDHTKLGDQMKEVAQSEGISVPTGISAKDHALETKLQSLTGDAFDKTYIQAMVKDHRHDLSEFKKQADSGNDTSIKEVASQGAQVISEHLNMAEQMAKMHNLQTNETADEGAPNGHREQKH